MSITPSMSVSFTWVQSTVGEITECSLGFHVRCFAGSHILSGNVFEPRALDELFPDWKAKQQAGEDGFGDLPVKQQVTKDKFYMLTKGGSIRLPTPAQMKNKGKNYVISLRWACRVEQPRSTAQHSTAQPTAQLTAEHGMLQLCKRRQHNACATRVWHGTV
jgi:hypothetical protein